MELFKRILAVTFASAIAMSIVSDVSAMKRGPDNELVQQAKPNKNGDLCWVKGNTFDKRAGTRVAKADKHLIDDQLTVVQEPVNNQVPVGEPVNNIVDEPMLPEKPPVGPENNQAPAAQEPVNNQAPDKGQDNAEPQHDAGVNIDDVPMEIDEKVVEEAPNAELLAAQEKAAADLLAAQEKEAARLAEVDRVAAQEKVAAELLAAQEKANAELLAAQEKAAADRIAEEKRVYNEKQLIRLSNAVLLTAEKDRIAAEEDRLAEVARLAAAHNQAPARILTIAGIVSGSVVGTTLLGIAASDIMFKGLSATNPFVARLMAAGFTLEVAAAIVANQYYDGGNRLAELAGDAKDRAIAVMHSVAQSMKPLTDHFGEDKSSEDGAEKSSEDEEPGILEYLMAYFKTDLP